MSDQPFQVNLSRPGPSPSWGFRLQGGCDFSTALSIQSVNPGSLAEQSGLRAGDSILQIGNRSTQDLEHDQAKQEIVNSGNNVFLVVQRGSVKVWQPKVTPLADLRSGPSSVPSQGPTADQYVQRTSLAADKQEPMKINFFNKSPRGFPGAGGGNSAPSAANNQAKPTVPVIMNAQYNTPMNMYSSNSAMEAFDQQSQALVGNMDGGYSQQGYGQQGAPAEPSQPSGGGGVQGMRSVRAPTGPPANVKIQQAQTMTCKACGTLIVGVFVRIKGDPLHPECFKCANCGKNLKNQGHFTVQGSLFCEVCVNA